MKSSYHLANAKFKANPVAQNPKPVIDTITQMNQHSATTIVDTPLEKKARLDNKLDPNDTLEEYESNRLGM